MTLPDLRECRLIIFTGGYTLLNVPWKDSQPLQMLPGRVDFLQQLVTERERHPEQGALAFALALDYQDVRFTYADLPYQQHVLQQVADWTGARYSRIALGASTPEMLQSLLQEAGVLAEQALMVVSRREDRETAQRVGIPYVWAGQFFPPTRLFTDEAFLGDVPE